MLVGLAGLSDAKRRLGDKDKLPPAFALRLAMLRAPVTVCNGDWQDLRYGWIVPQSTSCSGACDHLFECKHTTYCYMTYAPEGLRLPHLRLAGSAEAVSCKWG